MSPILFILAAVVVDPGPCWKVGWYLMAVIFPLVTLAYNSDRRGTDPGGERIRSEISTLEEKRIYTGWKNTLVGSNVVTIRAFHYMRGSLAITDPIGLH